MPLIVAHLGAFARAVHIEAKLRDQREVAHEGEGPGDDAVVCRAQHPGHVRDGDEREDESGGRQDDVHDDVELDRPYDRFARLLGHESSRLYLICRATWDMRLALSAYLVVSVVGEQTWMGGTVLKLCEWQRCCIRVGIRLVISSRWCEVKYR